ncbi:MAG: sugar transferase [Geodermatophilaceae bacterium]
MVHRRRRALSGFAVQIIAGDVAALGIAWALIRINSAVAVLMGVIGVGLIALAGLYRSRLTLSALDAVPALLGRTVVAGALAQAAGHAVNEESGVRNVVGTAVAWALTMTLIRALAYAHIRRRRSLLQCYHPTLILGAGVVGARIADVLRAHSEYGLHPVGFVDDDPLIGEPVLGGVGDLARVIIETRARDIVVAFSSLRESQLVDVLRSCDRLDGEIYLVPRLFELYQPSSGTDQVWGIPMIRLPRTAFRSHMLAVKRAMDCAIAAIALICLAPALALCALGAWRETGGVLFRQERIGNGGRPFNLMKFQSLRPTDEDESAQLWSVSADDRVGPVGRFLRRTSLDELPQLWNILCGDMSFVGPRPERPHFAGQFAGAFPRYAARTRVTAGLTGWAQVHNLRGDTSIEDRVAFDNHYIEHWSLWGDVKIMLRTVKSVVKATGQ